VGEKIAAARRPRRKHGNEQPYCEFARREGQRFLPHESPFSPTSHNCRRVGENNWRNVKGCAAALVAVKLHLINSENRACLLDSQGIFLDTSPGYRKMSGRQHDFG
jgi:hypothetical protein